MPNRIRTLGPLLAVAFVVAACGQQTVLPGQPTGVSISEPGSPGVPGSAEQGSDGQVSGGQVTGNGAPTEVTTETITGPVARLEVASDAGTIRVVGADGAEVTVTRSIYRDPVAPTETVRHDGDLLHIESQCPVPVQTTPCRIDYEVQVPRGTTVTIAGAAGDLSTSGLTGPQAAKSVSGDVDLAGAGGDTLIASSTSGDIQLGLDVVPRRVEAESVSGGVTVTVPDGSYRVDADTVSGDVDIDVPTDPSADASLQLESTSGDIEVRTG